MQDQERFRCRVCGKTFRSESGLKTHMKTEHAGRYYSMKIGIPLTLIILIIVFSTLFIGLPTMDQQTTQPVTLKKAPDFTLPAYSPSGLGEVSLSEFEGKPVFLEFFSPTCSYCLKMIPTIEKLRELYGDKMIFIIISVPDENNLEKVVEEYRLDTVILLDDRKLTVFKSYEVSGTPTFFILDSSHNVVRKIVGETNENILTSAIREAIR